MAHCRDAGSDGATNRSYVVRNRLRRCSTDTRFRIEGYIDIQTNSGVESWGRHDRVRLECGAAPHARLIRNAVRETLY